VLAPVNAAGVLGSAFATRRYGGDATCGDQLLAGTDSTAMVCFCFRSPSHSAPSRNILRCCDELIIIIWQVGVSTVLGAHAGLSDGTRNQCRFV
jgi:hypothetical protein